MAVIEKEELDYLERVGKAIIKKLDNLDIKLAGIKKDFDSAKKTLSDDFYYYDKEGSLGKIYSDISKLEERINQGESERKHLRMQLSSPYFARIDFTPNGDTLQKIYIGINSLIENDVILIADWRTPIASMYYDCSLGKASFNNEKE